MFKVFRSIGYAVEGIWYGVSTQRNMKIHLTVAPIVLILGAIVSLKWVEWCIIILVIAAVMSLELVNTAIEALVDIESPQYQPLAKIAKDVAAGAVLLMAIGSVCIGSIIIVPKLWELLF
ncbi:diacylglycerol kinase family protein [Paenibacillus endoradicis]|uniref:diacylglycerol kinase family protein n=1 Tax=Paenibacillus endoradicis TaxID=2972487 RepID=UPI0021598614|nr:diacylglycerol kinase family protein [Paenibacillus endoradicis]MCR8659226.1 diacylglycerol kinase family protein [Paenibacillus endoradicis]